MHALSQLHSGADGGATGGGFDESAVRLRRGVAQRRPARDQGVCRSGDENLSTRGAQGPGRVLPVGTAARGSLAQSLRRLCGTRALRTRADCTSRRGRPRSHTRHARTRDSHAHAHTRTFPEDARERDRGSLVRDPPTRGFLPEGQTEGETNPRCWTSKPSPAAGVGRRGTEGRRDLSRTLRTFWLTPGAGCVECRTPGNFPMSSRPAIAWASPPSRTERIGSTQRRALFGPGAVCDIAPQSA